jgi:hypothetical protein
MCGGKRLLQLVFMKNVHAKVVYYRPIFFVFVRSVTGTMVRAGVGCHVGSRSVCNSVVRR